MKRFIVMIMMASSAAGVATAADVVTLRATNGNVTFNHKSHQAMLSCKACHKDGTPAKLHLQKDFAHRLCKGCHEIRGGSAPIRCELCHKK